MADERTLDAAGLEGAENLIGAGPGRTRDRIDIQAGRDRSAEAPDREMPVDGRSRGVGETAEEATGRRRRSVQVGDLPEGMETRYLSEKRRLAGEQRFFENATDGKPVFRDKGDRLLTDRNGRDVVKDMVSIAEHRGWDRISVSGTEEFRREAWREASLRGLEVDGYKPNAREVQEVERLREQRDGRSNNISQGGARAAEATQRDAGGLGGAVGPDRAPARPDFLKGVEGRITEVGEAKFDDRPGAKPTPYVDLDLADGRKERAWGVGLPAALRETGVSVGDLVTLRRLGTERVEVAVQVVDPETGTVSTETRAANRNRWSAEGQRDRPDVDPSQATSPSQAGSGDRGAVPKTADAGDSQARDVSLQIGRTAPERVRERDGEPRLGVDGGRVERAFNPGDEVLGVRTAPTRDTSERDNSRDRSGEVAGAKRSENDARTVRQREDDPMVAASDRRAVSSTDAPPRMAPGIDGPTSRVGAPSPGRNHVDEDGMTRSRAAERRAVVGIAGEPEGERSAPVDRNRELADRFRRATASEAASDPELRAAQSQLVAGKALSKAYLPDNKEAQSKAAEKLRETIAQRLERGETIQMAKARQGRGGAPELVVPAGARAERSVPEHRTSEQTRPAPAPIIRSREVTKAPERGRGR